MNTRQFHAFLNTLLHIDYELTTHRLHIDYTLTTTLTTIHAKTGKITEFNSVRT